MRLTHSAPVAQLGRLAQHIWPGFPQVVPVSTRTPVSVGGRTSMGGAGTSGAPASIVPESMGGGGGVPVSVSPASVGGGGGGVPVSVSPASVGGGGGGRPVSVSPASLGGGGGVPVSLSTTTSGSLPVSVAMTTSFVGIGTATCPSSPHPATPATSASAAALQKRCCVNLMTGKTTSARTVKTTLRGRVFARGWSPIPPEVTGVTTSGA